MPYVQYMLDRRDRSTNSISCISCIFCIFKDPDQLSAQCTPSGPDRLCVQCALNRSGSPKCKKYKNTKNAFYRVGFIGLYHWRILHILFKYANLAKNIHFFLLSSLPKVWSTQEKTSAAQTLLIGWLPVFLMVKIVQIEITIPPSLQVRLWVTKTLQGLALITPRTWLCVYLQAPRSDLLAAMENVYRTTGPDPICIPSEQFTGESRRETLGGEAAQISRPTSELAYCTSRTTSIEDAAQLLSAITKVGSCTYLI